MHANIPTLLCVPRNSDDNHATTDSSCRCAKSTTPAGSSAGLLTTKQQATEKTMHHSDCVCSGSLQYYEPGAVDVTISLRNFHVNCWSMVHTYILPIIVFTSSVASSVSRSPNVNFWADHPAVLWASVFVFTAAYWPCPHPT